MRKRANPQLKPTDQKVFNLESEETLLNMCADYLHGITIEDIAKKYKCSLPTVYRYKKRFNWDRLKSRRISRKMSELAEKIEQEEDHVTFETELTVHNGIKGQWIKRLIRTPPYARFGVFPPSPNVRIMSREPESGTIHLEIFIPVHS